MDVPGNRLMGWVADSGEVLGGGHRAGMFLLVVGGVSGDTISMLPLRTGCLTGHNHHHHLDHLLIGLLVLLLLEYMTQCILLSLKCHVLQYSLIQ